MTNPEERSWYRQEREQERQTEFAFVTELYEDTMPELTEKLLMLDADKRLRLHLDSLKGQSD